MPRNPSKRPCAVPGCRAWARRGSALCASHERSRILQKGAKQVMPLFYAVASHPPAEGVPSFENGLAVIDAELRRLFEAREQFMAWVAQARDEGERLTPAQFLRAWNDSTTRVIQLLRARRELTSGSAEDGLFNAVYDALEAMLPKEASSTEGGGDAQEHPGS